MAADQLHVGSVSCLYHVYEEVEGVGNLVLVSLRVGDLEVSSKFGFDLIVKFKTISSHFF